MRLLILNQHALPRGSAGGTRHGELAAELVKRGHDVTVVASGFDYLTRRFDRSGPGGRYAELIDGVTFIWLRTGRYRKNDAQRAKSMVRYLVAATREGFRTARPDVVIGSSPNLLAGVAAALVSRSRAVPFVFEARDFWPSALVDLGALRRDSLAHRALLLVERWLYRSAAQIVSVPPEGWRRIAETGEDPAKVVHIPNIASAEVAPPVPLSPELTRLLEESNGRFVVAHTGAQGVLNGLDDVVSAATLLRVRRPDLYKKVLFLLVGDGQMRSTLESRVRAEHIENVAFVDTVPKGAVPQLLSQVDVGLVNTARADYFRYGLSPNKLFDYFAAGRPVLISAEGPTIVDQRGAGIRFRPGNPESLAEAIESMTALSDSDREDMGQRGHALVRERYALNHLVDAYEDLLLSVVRGESDSGTSSERE